MSRDPHDTIWYPPFTTPCPFQVGDVIRVDQDFHVIQWQIPTAIVPELDIACIPTLLESQTKKDAVEQWNLTCIKSHAFQTMLNVPDALLPAPAVRHAGASGSWCEAKRTSPLMVQLYTAFSSYTPTFNMPRAMLHGPHYGIVASVGRQQRDESSTTSRTSGDRVTIHHWTINDGLVIHDDIVWFAQGHPVFLQRSHIHTLPPAKRDATFLSLFQLSQSYNHLQSSTSDPPDGHGCSGPLSWSQPWVNEPDRVRYQNECKLTSLRTQRAGIRYTTVPLLQHSGDGELSLSNYNCDHFAQDLVRSAEHEQSVHPASVSLQDCMLFIMQQAPTPTFMIVMLIVMAWYSMIKRMTRVHAAKFA